MKKKYIFIIILLLAAAAAAYWYFRSGEKEQPITFATAKAQYGYIGKSVTATGTIQPVDTVSVGAQVSGVVKKVYVDFNSVVKQGQLLATVDPSILSAQVEESKAALASAISNLDYQKSTFDRQSQLFGLGAISKADYQVALNQYNAARAAVNNVSAQLKVTQKTLSYTNIYSPVNGVVLNRNVSEGQTIASSFNAPVLFVIAKDLTKMQVNAAVDEADIGGVLPGQNVTFTVDAFPKDIFRGSVQEILLHATVSANVVTYTTLINVDNTNLKLRPGMTASINIFLEEDSNALLIPVRAINFKPDSSLLKQFKIIRPEKNRGDISSGKNPNGYTKKDSTGSAGQGNEEIHRSHVWIRTGDSLVSKRIITGLADDVNVKVISGLVAGDEVITNTTTNGSTSNAPTADKSPFAPRIQQRPQPKKN
jgi:HlyD family secretion protein